MERITTEITYGPEMSSFILAHDPLSGILDEQYEEVRAAYAALGFAEVSNRLIGEWRTGLFAATP